ncbi:MAG: hypothetical protein FIA99_05555 [Ruminiclostridium sp.]|nr:hypothetical protein [Ruminiclostridium sp.]
MEEVNISRDYRKVPANRLTNRLGLAEYDRHLQFVDNNLKAGRYVLPLKQHIGAHSVPVVKPGDLVDTGTLVAVIPENSIGANLHSPAKGIVKEVSANIVIEA